MSAELLNLAGRYAREVAASVERVWENVFDWEHLPSLHEESFASVELVSQDARGWRIRVVNKPGDASRPQLLKLDADRDAGRYRVTTLNGPGRGSRIDTALTALAPGRTAIAVEFRVAEADPTRLAAIGRRYAVVYERLWDEDEAMMQAREAALAVRKSRLSRGTPLDSLDLGDEAEVRARLPLPFDFSGDPFRLVEVGGALVAHSVVCPHWLGPLDGASIIGGRVRCPWHGYLFDVRTGCSADGRGLRLARAPDVTLLRGRVYVGAGGKT